MATLNEFNEEAFLILDKMEGAKLQFKALIDAAAAELKEEKKILRKLFKGNFDDKLEAMKEEQEAVEKLREQLDE